MTVSNEAQLPATDAQKSNDKEYNFAQIRKQLEQEREGRIRAEARADELTKASQQRSSQAEEDDDSEPYVDHKRLDRKLSSFEKRLDEKIEQKAEQKARILIDEERKSQWMKANADFYDVMQHAQKLAEKDPELADTILQMPDGFERQKLVYKSIKSMGIHKPEEPKISIQDKIESNRKSPYYQPSGVANAPYAAAGDFSPAGKENAYKKMQELKNRLRM